MKTGVVVYQVKEHHRSKVICEAMLKGIRAVGDRVERVWEDEYLGPSADVAVFYGLEGNLSRIFKDYKRAGRAVYVDLGYWGRRQGGRFSGYHKVSINARHPTDYFQARKHDDARARALNVRVQPWRHDGQHILLAGMGAKGANAEGFRPEEWERKTIAEIRRHTTRRIIYRPKPSWKQARPIDGVGYSPRTQDVADVLKNAWCVVTHHSNVAVDGIVAGIPAFTWGGVGQVMGSQDISLIERPHRPDGREQWVSDIAYTQWSIREMSEGLPWRHLKNEGLIP